MIFIIDDSFKYLQEVIFMSINPLKAFGLELRKLDGAIEEA